MVNRRRRQSGGRLSLFLIVSLIGALLVAAAVPAGGQSGPDGPPTVSGDGNELWVLDEFAPLASRAAADDSLPDRFQPATLNRSLMESLLATAPREFTAAAASSPLVLPLPTPEGTLDQFAVEEAPILAPELAALYPTIRSYRGQGIDDPTATVAFTNGPLGFKAQIRSANRDWFVTPQSSDGTTVAYMSFLERDLPGDSAFTEPALDEFLGQADILPEDGTASSADDPIQLPPPDQAAATPTGTQLRTHRLAVSTTGAYSQQFADDDTNITNSVVNLVTFLNGIYEVELAVRFSLVATAIFKEPTPRPATAACESLGPVVAIESIENLGAVFIRTTAAHGLAVGDTIVIAGSDPQINGEQTVLQLSNVTPETAFFINNGAAVDPAFTGTLQKKNLVVDPPYCDPFTFGVPSANLSPNQTVLDNLTGLGDANYDIGHVLGHLASGGSGVAGLNSVGVAGRKARGASHASDVANAIPSSLRNIIRHEVGHQYDGPHTFNGIRGNCATPNYDASSAVEPASGSTIMSYGGICENSPPPGGDDFSDDIVDTQDPFFHAWSLELMNNHLNTTGTLATGTPNGNNPPTVTVTGGPFTIPAQTPFTLAATATDPQGDPLTYIWEQIDLATGGQRVLENPDVATGPLFRSFTPQATGNERTIPSLDKILDNNTNAATGNCPGVVGPATVPTDPVVQCFAEFLPTNAGLTGNRTLGISRVTARDNRAGGGGVNSADTTVTVVDNTGPFVVTAPNTAVTWPGNSVQTVTWNVANTNNAPISTANVDIHLSVDEGQSWQLLAAGTPNDGTHAVTVPNVATTQARVRVQGAGNIFFDISDVSFTITGPVGLVFVPLTPTACFDTRFPAPNILAGGTTRSFHITGTAFDFAGQGGIAGGCGIPANAAAVLLNLVAVDPTGGGNLQIAAQGVTPSGGVVNYQKLTPNLNNSNALPVGLANGKVDVRANGQSVHTRGIALGYYVDPAVPVGGLVFIPVPPAACFDTRFPAPNLLAGGTGRNFTVRGAGDFTGQGGGAAGCGIPAAATAIMINLVAVNPTGGGNLKIDATNAQPVAGGVVNYQALAPNLNNSNAVPIAMSGTGTVNVYANGSGVHVRGVALGYFAPAGTVGGLLFNPLTPTACFDTRTPANLLAANAGRDFSLEGAGGFSAQGGLITGCGVPTTATAAMLNLVAINATGGGNLKIDATNAGAVNGGVVNFQALAPNLNNSNALPIATSGTGAANVYANGSSAHIRGIALGYFVPAP